jgi:hypothetical protein
LNPGIVGRLCETPPKSVAVNEIFGDLNQEARKTGGDQEFLELPGLKAWPLLRIRYSMASRLNLIPAFLRDNLS